MCIHIYHCYIHRHQEVMLPLFVKLVVAIYYNSDTLWHVLGLQWQITLAPSPNMRMLNCYTHNHICSFLSVYNHLTKSAWCDQFIQSQWVDRMRGSHQADYWITMFAQCHILPTDELHVPLAFGHLIDDKGDSLSTLLCVTLTMMRTAHVYCIICSAKQGCSYS